jgi:hypothetical protein
MAGSSPAGCPALQDVRCCEYVRHLQTYTGDIVTKPGQAGSIGQAQQHAHRIVVAHTDFKYTGNGDFAQP